MNNFNELSLCPALQANLTRHGFSIPTPVQAQSIPPALEGRDVVATAQTGTGKTLAFLLPMVQSLLSKTVTKGAQAVVLSPTRELAIQIHDTFQLLTQGTPLRAAIVVGGMNENKQLHQIRMGAQVLIATPLDPQTQTAAKCNYCTHRVDAGFEPACVVVCPVEAIVSGDLDDPDSRIAQLDRAQKVQYPKVEKGTQPKLFYVGGETAAVDPAAAPPGREYVWSGNDGRIDERALRAADEEAEGEARARRVYDPLSKPRPWGWMVSAYISTKAVASGVVMAGFGLFALGRLSAAVTTQIMIISIVFLMLTGALLVGDLKQPRRFLYVLLRPQWKSWLVRGAYVIAAFGVMLPVAWIAGLAGASWSAQAWLGGVLAVLAALAAMYTGFLLAQARGRDYWQSPLLPVVMLVDALAAGLAVLALTGTLPEAEAGGGSASLLAVVVSLIVLTSVEFLTRHQTRNAERTARLILRGPYAGWFWGGVVAVGLLAPLVILLLSGPEAAACVLILAGIGAKNHVLVQAPQDVPLS